VEILAVDHPNDPSGQLAGSLRRFGGKGKRGDRDLQKGVHSQREGAAGCHQDSACADVKASCELQRLLAIATDATQKDRKG